MSKAILALNAGSSSIKFAVYRADGKNALVCKGHLDKHEADAQFTIKGPDGKVLDEQKPTISKSSDLTLTLLDRIKPHLDESELAAVGHRIVHGGPRFFDPTIVQGDVLGALEKLTPLAPLHQPGCLAPIRSLSKARPDLFQVVCFDTAFHRHLPPVHQRFPVPDLDDGIHRYGFHGLSVEYIAGHIKQPNRRAVIAHLGSGSSLCALHDGKSINTTMSLTPLDGLMMATRSGAIDPGLLLYLQRAKGLSVDQLEDLLYHKSGLLGVSGASADMRVLLSRDDAPSRLAVDQFCARAAEHIASMATSLGGLDLIVFTGGVGENSAPIRSKICESLRWIGIELSPADNDKSSATISAESSRIVVQVVPTDEESVISKHTRSLM